MKGKQRSNWPTREDTLRKAGQRAPRTRPAIGAACGRPRPSPWPTYATVAPRVPGSRCDQPVEPEVGICWQPQQLGALPNAAFTAPTAWHLGLPCQCGAVCRRNGRPSALAAAAPGRAAMGIVGSADATMTAHAMRSASQNS